jgi:hypothetical protein
VKLVGLVPVPPGVVTETGPVVVRFGTVATISVSELTWNDAGLPWNFTTEVPVYPVPVIVTVVPLGPLGGTKSSTVGSGDGVTTKSTALVPVPSPSVTVTGPVAAAAGTVAVICVLLSTLKDVADVPLKATPFARLASAKPVPVIVTDVPVGARERQEDHDHGRQGSRRRGDHDLRAANRQCERRSNGCCPPLPPAHPVTSFPEASLTLISDSRSSRRRYRRRASSFHSGKSPDSGARSLVLGSTRLRSGTLHLGHEGRS